MTLPVVKWGVLKKYFTRKKGFYIYHVGGDAFIAKEAKGSGERGKKVVRIGHNFQHHSTKIPDAIINKIRRTFEISRDDILSS